MFEESPPVFTIPEFDATPVADVVADGPHEYVQHRHGEWLRPGHDRTCTQGFNIN